MFEYETQMRGKKCFRETKHGAPLSSSSLFADLGGLAEGDRKKDRRQRTRHNQNVNDAFHSSEYPALLLPQV